MTESLYTRLGGYDAISAVSRELVSRARADDLLGRFWNHRGDDEIARELQFLIDYLCANSGGDMYYKGRDIKTAHAGMQINNDDWTALTNHLKATLDDFSVPDVERQEVINFIENLKTDVVEA